jgi:hypothetical protein
MKINYMNQYPIQNGSEKDVFDLDVKISKGFNTTDDKIEKQLATSLNPICRGPSVMCSNYSFCC